MAGSKHASSADLRAPGAKYLGIQESHRSSSVGCATPTWFAIRTAPATIQVGKAPNYWCWSHHLHQLKSAPRIILRQQNSSPSQLLLQSLLHQVSAQVIYATIPPFQYFQCFRKTRWAWSYSGNHRRPNRPDLVWDWGKSVPSRWSWWSFRGSITAVEDVAIASLADWWISDDQLNQNPGSKWIQHLKWSTCFGPTETSTCFGPEK